jgi:hypothetical protein
MHDHSCFTFRSAVQIPQTRSLKVHISGTAHAPSCLACAGHQSTERGGRILAV